MSARLQTLGKLGAKVVCQYVWGVRKGHRDELILRDRDATTSSSESSGEFLNERLWCLMDYYDPTSIVDNSGSVVERYRFSAFGLRGIMSAGFTPLDTSGYDWDFAFKGQFLDMDTGYYNYGYRYYSPDLGRWLSRDPIGERGGNNLYDMCGNSPINYVDKFGLISQGDVINTGAAKITITTLVPVVGTQFYPGIGMLPVGGLNFRAEVEKTPSSCCDSFRWEQTIIADNEPPNKNLPLPRPDFNIAGPVVIDTPSYILTNLSWSNPANPAVGIVSLKLKLFCIHGAKENLVTFFIWGFEVSANKPNPKTNADFTVTPT